MLLDLNTINSLEVAGIGFHANISIPGGGRDVILKAADLQEFAADPEKWAAAHFGVSKENYRDWIATDGTPRCSALTKKGKPCQGTFRRGCQMDIAEWMEADGGYCVIHDGSTSS